MTSARSLDDSQVGSGGPPEAKGRAPTCQCIDWFHEGEFKVVEIGGIQVTVRYIGRKGRRGRIAIEAPAGAVFSSDDGARENKVRLDATPRNRHSV